MNPITEAANAITAALSGIDGVRYYTDLGATIDPPATILGPPSLTWDAYNTAPTTAQFRVFLVVAANEHAITQLFDLVPVVAAALDVASPNLVVTQAQPASWPAGAGDLPAYEIQIDADL